MNDFNTAPLGERAILFDHLRRPVTKKDRISGKFPYYGASGIIDHVDDYIFDGTYLLVAEDGENLQSRKTPIAFLASGRFWLNNHAHILQGNENNDTRFLSYALESMDISGFITGSTQPKLSQSALRSIQISAPSLAEQQSIAATLGALDDKIDSNKRVMSHIRCLLDTLSASLGVALPTTPLSSLAVLIKHGINPQILNDATVDLYSLPAFDSGERPEHVSPIFIKSSKNIISSPAILVSRLNPRIDRTWWVNPTPEVRALASTEFACLTEPDGELAAVWLAVRNPYFLEQIKHRVTGTSGSHQRIRPTDMMRIEVPDFRLLSSDQKSSVRDLLHAHSQHNRENETLESIRDALLPELMSGRIRVPEAQEATEDAIGSPEEKYDAKF